MELYFFHIRENGKLITDREGQEFPDLDAARDDAFEAAREIAAEQVKNGEPLDNWSFSIEDRRGNVLATIDFESALSHR